MNIKDIQKRIQRYVHRDKSKLYITPYYSWAAMLTVWSLLLVGAFGFSYHVYMQYYIQGVEDVSNGQEDVAEKGDVELLRGNIEEILQYFDQKEEGHNELLKKQETFERVIEKDEEVLPSEEDDAGEKSNDTETNAETTSTFDVLQRQAASIFLSVREFVIDLVW